MDSDWRRVRRRPSMSPSAARRARPAVAIVPERHAEQADRQVEQAESVVQPRHRARLSWDAKMLLTKMLTCTAASPTVAGAIRRADRAQRPGRAGAHSGRKRQPRLPQRRAPAPRTAPGRRAACRSPSRATTCSGGRPSAHSNAAHAIVTTLNSAGESAGTPKRSSAFSIPIATAAKDTSGRNGIMTRVSRTVSSALPGLAARSPERATATSGPANAIPSDDHAASSTARSGSGRGSRGGRPPRGLAPSPCAHRWGRTPPRARLRRTGRAAGSGSGRRSGRRRSSSRRPSSAGEHLLADQPEHARDERHARRRAPPRGRCALLGRRPLVLDLGRRGH